MQNQILLNEAHYKYYKSEEAAKDTGYNEEQLNQVAEIIEQEANVLNQFRKWIDIKLDYLTNLKTIIENEAI